MLGKRARSIRRNASSFSFMDLHLPRPTTTSPLPPPPFPQVVGFNPSHNRSDIPIRFNPFTPPDRPPFSADPPSPAPRSSVFRRSALQTLLAAARQAVELKDNCSDAVMVSPPLAGAARTYFLSQSEDFQESTASQASDEANETLLTDIDFSMSSPEKKCLLNSVDRMSNSNHGPAKEGRGNSLSESCHFLFLATSPLTDATTLSPMMNFLDSCYLCKRPLGHGSDIFMYRGGTAFCSAECRYSQILMDERKEKPSPSMLRSGSGSASSSYLHGRNRRSLVMQAPAGTAAAA